jgi:hypothetical protein
VKVTFSSPSRHSRTKELGARAFVKIDDRGRWHGHYHFDTHGMSPARTAAKIRDISDRHDKWASRMTGFAGVLNVEIVISGVVYRIVDCTIPNDGPYEHVQLHLAVRKVDGESLQKLDGWPLVLQYNSITDVPPNEQIIGVVRARLLEQADKKNKHDKYVRDVEALVAEARDGRGLT